MMSFQSLKLAHLYVPLFALGMLSLSACEEHAAHAHEEKQPIVVTTPDVQDVVITQQFVCQIHSRRHIIVRAQHKEAGYLEEIRLSEGQAVKAGEVLFRIKPTLYKTRYDAELAEAKLAQLEYDNTLRLFEKKVVSQNELSLYEAKLAKAQAKAKQAEAELNFTEVRAPFDGIIDRLHEQQGSLVKEGDKLTTLSDNSVVWVYFNIPETRYLEYMSQRVSAQRSAQLELADSRIELLLADGRKFPQSGGNKVTIEGEFNRETGNIPFRADFPNPDGLLRHGQTGNIQIHRTFKNTLVIPQRATFEILDKHYVYVVDKNHVVRQREIQIQNEQDDIYIIKGGITKDDLIVLDGVKQVKDGEKIEFKVISSKESLSNLKNPAE